MDVSVIIPVYNSEKYLSACIDSVLHQEEVTLEIILVDDGSTDSSGSICDEYANKYEIIRTVHIKNSGQAVAKNEGLKYAKGNYIALTVYTSLKDYNYIDFNLKENDGKKQYDGTSIFIIDASEIEIYYYVQVTDWFGEDYIIINNLTAQYEETYLCFDHISYKSDILNEIKN
jgi:glycosyltransferase involved in cell wall biosynthesis